MPPPRFLPRAAGRSATCWVVLAVLTLVAGPVAADHGAAPLARGGLDWMSWLLIVGALVAVVLVAWAFFAPSRPERPVREARERAEPEARIR